MSDFSTFNLQCTSIEDKPKLSDADSTSNEIEQSLMPSNTYDEVNKVNSLNWVNHHLKFS